MHNGRMVGWAPTALGRPRRGWDLISTGAATPGGTASSGCSTISATPGRSASSGETPGWTDWPVPRRRSPRPRDNALTPPAASFDAALSDPGVLSPPSGVRASPATSSPFCGGSEWICGTQNGYGETLSGPSAGCGDGQLSSVQVAPAHQPVVVFGASATTRYRG